MPDRQILRVQPVRLFAIFTILALAISLAITRPAVVNAAACQKPASDYGTATASVTIPEAATYRVWTRMNTANVTNSTYLLEIDGNTCYNVGGSGLTAGSWGWISHRDGNTASKTDLALAKGAHSLKLIGNKAGVKVDHLVFASDLACVPQTAAGSECNVPDDTTPPSVQLTAPAANSSVSGTTQITATATDNTQVVKVEFYINNALVNTDTVSPYNYSWNTVSFRNEPQLLEARAFDAAGNSSRDSYRVTVQNGDQQAPTAPTNLSATAPAYNKVNLTWQASNDDKAVTGYRVLRNGVPVVTVGAVTTYADNSVVADTAYSYQVIALDAADNASPASNTAQVRTPKVPAQADTTAPSKPANLAATAVSSQQINLTWQASTDNTGVVRYDIYRSQGASAQKIASSTVTSYGDTGLSANTSYTYYIIAVDGAGNASAQSSTANATTKATTSVAVIQGVLRDQRTNKPLAQAVVIDDYKGRQYISMTDSKGNYVIAKPQPGARVLAYHAHGYQSAYYNVTLGENESLIKNVTLRKR